MTQNTAAMNRAGKGSLYSFIVFLAISALLAITFVLTGSFGTFEIKVLVTTSVIAFASICSLCCGAYSQRSRNSAAGLTGISVAGVCSAMLILGAWVEMNSGVYWRAAAVLGTFSIAFAHSLALLAVRLRPAHCWIQPTMAINIFALAAVISFMIMAGIKSEGAFKLIAILAILITLETLVIPILGRLAKTNPCAARTTLSLTIRDDGLYEDPHGLLYEVKETSLRPASPAPLPPEKW